MASNPTRVVVWATGGIGSIAIRAIQRRPDIELVGVWVHSESKVGKDAGELANGEPIGLAATNDADALIALKPDCIIYAASGPERDALAIPDYVRLLEAGINIVTTSTTRLVNPHAYEPAEWRDQLAAAAKQGHASLYASGIEPGFAADYLPLVLSTLSSTIEKIHAFEIGLYDDYGVPDIMINGLGFGQPLDYQPWVAIPGAIAGEWQGQIRLIADALGFEVQEVRENFDRAETNRTLNVAMGTVEAGTCGALRMQAIGVVDGRETIVVEHITRLAHDVAPDWPTGIGDLSYRVVISGDPDLECTLAATLKDPRRAGVEGMTSGAGAMVATAMRVLNAVPYVVAAEPGLLSSVDLPLTIPRNAFLTQGVSTSPQKRRYRGG
jgi:2,4-diaminopentanoate dehydrogenase